MNSKAILPAVVAAVLGLSGLAQAQTTTQPHTTTAAPSTGNTSTAPVVSGTGSATNNAVNTAPANNSGAPVPGANSFTEGQARDRIQDKGFTQVNALSLDSKGVWRGKAMKNGQSVDVSMDYQGNVVPQ
ncbi:MAG: hypothetical protein EOO66_07435 [Methylobacterium sp.]|nr:MAG: hypothetical protein EOO66_07435 [Methylobacterium sp.]